jgi:hypothetical protein
VHSVLVDPCSHIAIGPVNKFCHSPNSRRYRDLRALSCSPRNLEPFKSVKVLFKSSGLHVFDDCRQFASGLWLDSTDPQSRSNTPSGPTTPTRFSKARSLTASSSHESSVRYDGGRLCCPSSSRHTQVSVKPSFALRLWPTTKHHLLTK